jgi:hypothetical protein
LYELIILVAWTGHWQYHRASSIHSYRAIETPSAWDHLHSIVDHSSINTHRQWLVKSSQPQHCCCHWQPPSRPSKFSIDKVIDKVKLVAWLTLSQANALGSSLRRCLFQPQRRVGRLHLDKLLLRDPRGCHDLEASEMVWVGSTNTSVLYLNGTSDTANPGGVSLWTVDLAESPIVG